MKRSLVLVALVLFISACGKNDGRVFAPYPPNGGYVGNNLPHVQYPYNQTGNRFQPTSMPSGFQNQYTPWLPMHQWMQQNPQRYNYYMGLLNNWSHYAQYRGYSPYYFPGFWLDYLPQQWSGYQLQPLYDYFQAYVYPWVGWNTHFPQVFSSPANYWGGYNGLPYQYLNTMYPASYNWGGY